MPHPRASCDNLSFRVLPIIVDGPLHVSLGGRFERCEKQRETGKSADCVLWRQKCRRHEHGCTPMPTFCATPGEMSCGPTQPLPQCCQGWSRPLPPSQGGGAPCLEDRGLDEAARKQPSLVEDPCSNPRSGNSSGNSPRSSHSVATNIKRYRRGRIFELKGDTCIIHVLHVYCFAVKYARLWLLGAYVCMSLQRLPIVMAADMSTLTWHVASCYPTGMTAIVS